MRERGRKGKRRGKKRGEKRAVVARFRQARPISSCARRNVFRIPARHISERKGREKGGGGEKGKEREEEKKKSQSQPSPHHSSGRLAPQPRGSGLAGGW